jgi:hypothetical protein
MYYKMVIEGGHVGAGKSLDTVRYFKGENPVDMFSMAARMPRSKGKETGIGVKLVQNVSRDEYLEGIRQMESDRYLNRRKRQKRSKRKKEVLFH